MTLPGAFLLLKYRGRLCGASRTGGEARMGPRGQRPEPPRFSAQDLEKRLAAPNPRVFTYYGRLAKVRAFVDLSLAGRIRLEDAARVAGLETTYFSRYFHAKTGLRFREWLARLRTYRAVRLFETREISIEAVAKRVGFGSSRTLERAFQKYLGTTPCTFREIVRPAPR